MTEEVFDLFIDLCNFSNVSAAHELDVIGDLSLAQGDVDLIL